MVLLNMDRDRRSLPILSNYDVERLMHGLGLVKYLVSISMRSFLMIFWNVGLSCYRIFIPFNQLCLINYQA